MGGWTYTQEQYYVGATEDGQLAVFRGVPGPDRRARPVQRAAQTSGTSLDDLTAVAQERVKQGIQADERAGRRSAGSPS